MATYTVSTLATITNQFTAAMWMRPISYALGLFGWLQQPDTGQPVWPVTTMHVNNCAAGGGTNVYTYDSLVGTAPALNQWVTVTGCTTGANNVAASGKITAVVPATSTTGTFSVAQGGGSNEAEGANCQAMIGINMVITYGSYVGGVATYEYALPTLGSGTPALPNLILHNGMVVNVAGFTSATALNLTGTISAVGGSPTHGNGAVGTFTIPLAGTGSEDCHANTPLVYASTSVTGTFTTGTWYEIWKTGDSGTGFDVYIKVGYGDGTAATVSIQMGTGTDGAKNLNNPTTAEGQEIANGVGSTYYPCHFSGDAGRFVMNLWHGSNNANFNTIHSLERSYDNSGNVTASYYTHCYSQIGKGSGNTQQSIFPSGANTTVETGGWCCAMPKTASSGNVGSTTHVSPVFPLVGGIGNPLTNLMAYRATDFADNQVVFVTIYGVQQTYITLGCNSNFVANFATASGLMTRFS